MSPGVQASTCASSDHDGGASVAWVVHPASGQPLRAVLVAVVLAVIGVAVYYMIDSLWWAVFASLMLVVSLRQFFLPTCFRLDDDAVVSRFLWMERRKEWSFFKSFFLDRNGILLSPFPGPSRLESFRGFYLMGANRLPHVLEFIERKLPRASTS